jgi:membrane-associated phospholipid phosphatase
MVTPYNCGYHQRPADTVTILFLVFLLLLTGIFYQALPKGPFLFGLYSVLIIVQTLLPRYRGNGRMLAISHDLIFPVICVLLIFDSLEWVVHSINPQDIDPLLIQLDYLIFGNHPTVMLERIMHPILTDLLQIAYSTYYFIPVSYGIVLLSKQKKDAFNRSIFLILFCFYLSYLGYIMFPAIGPRFTIDHLQTRELQGFLVAEPIQHFLDRLEGIKRDAFPSGHTAVTLVVLYCAYRFERRFFWIYLPIVAALIFATVYCRYHYVVDVIAGLFLTLFCVVAGEGYYNWWLRRATLRDSSRQTGKGSPA